MLLSLSVVTNSVIGVHDRFSLSQRGDGSCEIIGIYFGITSLVFLENIPVGKVGVDGVSIACLCSMMIEANRILYPV